MMVDTLLLAAEMHAGADMQAISSQSSKPSLLSSTPLLQFSTMDDTEDVEAVAVTGTTAGGALVTGGVLEGGAVTDGGVLEGAVGAIGIIREAGKLEEGLMGTVRVVTFCTSDTGTRNGVGIACAGLSPPSNSGDN